MFDVIPPSKQLPPTTSALQLFDRAMQLRAVSADIVRAAQYLNSFSDQELSELGINRSDLDDTIQRFI
ncbi:MULTISPECIES: DUF1127 domain-containing protein [Ruegeria]|jgi:uncharacterized protein YjiS (DUF1127 family)|uniref:DUF1127 domain-containing protein n=1 Tax=Ruegeria atlantica TaxID=81569 RepID=A0A0P1EE63_9RHOB|nr:MULTISPECIES: DUF1127 domain-containing protein [Ruegeria]CUH47755.1 hypothetical protein RUA4292_01931 [Ruegeria atlantica]